MAKLPLLSSRTSRRDWRARWPRTPGMMPALLGMSLAAVVPASATHDQALVSDSVAPAPLSRPDPAPNPSAAAAPLSPTAVAEPEIEAVSGALARRFRISEQATREFVGTAYGEGRRIGLDPLLIVAVIAVESRFNPIAQSDGGAIGLMQVIPRYHGTQFDAARGESVLDPRTNIELGARVLKEYIRRAGTEVAGLQLYNGSADDPSNGYANKVLGERQRLQQAVRRVLERNRA